MADHRLIKRRDLPGYCPQRWCAVCGKAASKNAPYVRCEGKNDCPNVCHSSCLGDYDVFMCDETQELRRMCSIEDAVVYLPLDDNASNTPTAPNGDDGGEDANADEGVDERQYYMEMNKEDLISCILRLEKEVTTKNNVIQSLTLQRDWILEKQTHMAELHELMRTLAECKTTDARNSSSSIANTTTPSFIQKTWERACVSSEHWRQWCQSGRPKSLKR